MRAFAVFLVTYVLSLIVLVSSYHAFLERADVSIIALSLSGLGGIFGAAAGCWNWPPHHPKAFLGASLMAAMTMLLPFVVITYGYALRAFPLVLLWMGMNFLGLKLTTRMRTKISRRKAGSPCTPGVEQ